MLITASAALIAGVFLAASAFAATVSSTQPFVPKGAYLAADQSGRLLVLSPRGKLLRRGNETRIVNVASAQTVESQPALRNAGRAMAPVFLAPHTLVVMPYCCQSPSHSPRSRSTPVHKLPSRRPAARSRTYAG
jgi:hypothetical protein